MISVLATFRLFGLPHCTAIVVTLLAAIASIRFLRSSVSERVKQGFRGGLAILLLVAVSLDPILTLCRYGTGLFGWEMLLSNSLPFYLCDVVSIILAIALITKNTRCAEIGYLWAVAGSLQGLFTPTLEFSWNTLEYYAFFIQHGGAPIAAVALIWGMKLYPQRGAFKRAILASWGYMAVIMSYNHFAAQNYGFLNAKPDYPTLFNYLGDYPYYLISLQLIAFPSYAILLYLANWSKRRELDDGK